MATKRQFSAAGSIATSEDVVAFLSGRAAYPERPKRVEVEAVQTHISWVFLTDEFAYKLKKPVRFDFLDFSTCEFRRKACEEEVRLNRRLARHVYLGVLPITRNNGRLFLDGDGAPIDWVVKMRRLPADRSLDKLVQSSNLTTQEVEHVGSSLSKFYVQLPPLTISPVAYRQQLERHIRDNRAALLAMPIGISAAAVRRTHEAQLLMLKLASETFDHRALDGRIVEGHGDLRPEHIYLAPSPTIIDCVEFNRELRQLDVLDELCFFAMECDRLGAGWVGDQVIADYHATSGDDCPPRLATFYKCYRASVRAKVSALRAGQSTGQVKTSAEHLANEYLRLADKLRSDLGAPVLLIVRGLSGTGKTTLAQALAESLEIEHLETDAIRREMFGNSQSDAGFGSGNYRPANRARVYGEMLGRAKKLIDAGCSAIVDGTFLTAKSRMDALVLAGGGRAVPLVIQCHCPDDVAHQRIADRIAVGGSLSESRPGIHAQQKEMEEPDPPGLPVCHVDATLSLPTMLDLVCQRLSAAWFSAN